MEQKAGLLAYASRPEVASRPEDYWLMHLDQTFSLKGYIVNVLGRVGHLQPLLRVLPCSFL